MGEARLTIQVHGREVDAEKVSVIVERIREALSQESK